MDETRIQNKGQAHTALRHFHKDVGYPAAELRRFHEASAFLAAHYHSVGSVFDAAHYRWQTKRLVERIERQLERR